MQNTDWLRFKMVKIDNANKLLKMKNLLTLSLAFLLIGCSSPSPIDNQFFGCTLGESSEADIMAVMEGYEISLYRQGFAIEYSNVPFGRVVWESVTFVMTNGILEGMIFSDKRSLPFVMQAERFNKKYSRYCKSKGKDVDFEWYNYSDGKTQIELDCSDLWPGTSLIYRDRSSSSWQEL